MTPSVTNGNQVISVTTRGEETPNYTFPGRWAKTPNLQVGAGLHRPHVLRRHADIKGQLGFAPEEAPCRLCLLDSFVGEVPLEAVASKMLGSKVAVVPVARPSVDRELT